MEDVLALVVGLAQELGVELVATFGSLLADVPHTRPAPVSAAASDASLVEEMGVEPSRYEGPTGIVGVLLDDCRAGNPGGEPLGGGSALRLARAEPARGARALPSLRRDARRRCRSRELEQASDEYSQQVTEAVASDAETSAYVEELEQRVDMMEAEEELPSGDSLAAELTQFLREREEKEDDDESAGGPAPE